MSQTSAIEWTEATWNPWMGCTKVSPGCARCYMFREQTQYGQNPERVRRSKTKFADPLRWKAPRTIFTCSWSDWFHEDADEWRDEAWDIIRRTPQHTYQILTKRPERIIGHLPSDWGDGWPNVWLGVSVENQRWVSRAHTLADIPAATRFISAEPLLKPITLTGLHRHPDGHESPLIWEFQWIIAGGESGPGFRPCDERWLRSIRDQCIGNNVAFFLKQLGGWPNKRGGELAVLDGYRWVDMPPQVTS